MNTKTKRIIQTFFKAKKHRHNKNYVVGKKTGFLKCRFSFKGKNNSIESNDCVFFGCKFYFFGSNNKIIVGTNSSFKNVEFWIEGDNNTIVIGDNCSFCGKAQIACLEGTNVSIGNGLLCSSDVFLRTSDSHSILDFNGMRTNHAKDITIGKKVWLCQKVSILKGSVIPDNCVVAYGSIVTKIFSQSNCVLGGCPAKIIKTNISWSEERLKNNNSNDELSSL